MHFSIWKGAPYLPFEFSISSVIIDTDDNDGRERRKNDADLTAAGTQGTNSGSNTYKHTLTFFIIGCHLTHTTM